MYTYYQHTQKEVINYKHWLKENFIDLCLHIHTHFRPKWGNWWVFSCNKETPYEHRKIKKHSPAYFGGQCYLYYQREDKPQEDCKLLFLQTMSVNIFIKPHANQSDVWRRLYEYEAEPMAQHRTQLLSGGQWNGCYISTINIKLSLRIQRQCLIKGGTESPLCNVFIHSLIDSYGYNGFCS